MKYEPFLEPLTAQWKKGRAGFSATELVGGLSDAVAKVVAVRRDGDMLSMMLIPADRIFRAFNSVTEFLCCRFSMS
jgi:hypothetical protein